MPESGAPDSFVEFFRAEFTRVVGFMMQGGASQADAEDAAQEAFVKARCHWATIDSPRAWVRQVAWHAHLKCLNRMKREQELAPGAEWTSGAKAVNSDKLEEKATVLRLIAALPPRQRQVMAWHFDDYSHADIARFTGLTLEAVAANLYQARKALKRMLRAELENGDEVRAEEEHDDGNNQGEGRGECGGT